jgi:hypothetical protein
VRVQIVGSRAGGVVSARQLAQAGGGGGQRTGRLASELSRLLHRAAAVLVAPADFTIEVKRAPSLRAPHDADCGLQVGAALPQPCPVGQERDGTGVCVSPPCPEGSSAWIAGSVCPSGYSLGCGLRRPCPDPANRDRLRPRFSGLRGTAASATRFPQVTQPLPLYPTCRLRPMNTCIAQVCDVQVCWNRGTLTQPCGSGGAAGRPGSGPGRAGRRTSPG